MGTIYYERREIVRTVRQRLAALLGHEDKVFETDLADPRVPETRCARDTSRFPNQS
jgi:hypothetical protein